MGLIYWNLNDAEENAIHEISRLFIENLLKKLKQHEVPDKYADLANLEVNVFDDLCLRKDRWIGVYGFLETPKGTMPAESKASIRGFKTHTNEHYDKLVYYAISEIKSYWRNHILLAKAVNEAFEGLL